MPHVLKMKDGKLLTPFGIRDLLDAVQDYHHFNRLDIEVYTDYKDPDMEANIEEVLTAHELYYEKSEVWIETEKMYEVLYELTV